MLVLSRRPHEKILIPVIRASIHVAAVEPGVVRVAIDAPPDVAILRGELPDREAEWGPPAPPARQQAPEPSAARTRAARRRRDCRTRRRLRAASIALGLVRLQLVAGLTRQAQAALDRIHEDIQSLRRGLRGGRAGTPRSAATLSRAAGESRHTAAMSS